MSVVTVSGLTFCYDGSYDNIFEDVSFQFDTAWRLGFIGRNGRGKTTFLNLLMGKYEYRGSISSSVSFDYFPFHVPDKTKLTREIVGDIVVLEEYEEWMLDRELNLLELPPDDVLWRPFDTLSNGEQTKVLLAALFLKEENYLLIDEPTNHLDMHAREVVGRYLRGKEGFLLVSHDRFFLDGCIDHVVSINRADIEIQRGNFSTWQANRQLQDNFELAENEKLQKQIRHLGEAARRTSDWSNRVEATKYGGGPVDRGYIGHKAAKMMKRSMAAQRRREDAVSEKEKLLKNIETADPLEIHPLEHHADTLVEVEGLSISYGDREVLSDVSFQLKNGERLAVLGRNGSGKSSLFQVLLGRLEGSAGAVRLASDLVISHVSQDTSFLAGSLGDYARACSIDESLFKSILHKLDFSRVQFEKDMRDYSGGQKKKVLIARSLCERAHLYLWDEPLNFVDVLSRIQLENLVLEYRPTLIVIEHDRSFVDAVGTKTISIG